VLLRPPGARFKSGEAAMKPPRRRRSDDCCPSSTPGAVSRRRAGWTRSTRAPSPACQQMIRLLLGGRRKALLVVRDDQRVPAEEGAAAPDRRAGAPLRVRPARTCTATAHVSEAMTTSRPLILDRHQVPRHGRGRRRGARAGQAGRTSSCSPTTTRYEKKGNNQHLVRKLKEAGAPGRGGDQLPVRRGHDGEADAVVCNFSASPDSIASPPRCCSARPDVAHHPEPSGSRLTARPPQTGTVRAPRAARGPHHASTAARARATTKRRSPWTTDVTFVGHMCYDEIIPSAARRSSRGERRAVRARWSPPGRQAVSRRWSRWRRRRALLAPMHEVGWRSSSWRAP
jgi:hypothetical protein